MGPPPIPRNDEEIPSAIPMAAHGTVPANRRVAMRSLLRMYTGVPAVIAASTAACKAPAMAALPSAPTAAPNSARPATPPTAAPSASGVSTVGSIVEIPASFEVTTE